jgi:hypothetical protein
MKDTIHELISIIRANPKQARIAITLDSIIGLTVALVTYLLLNTTGMTFTFGAAVVVNAVLFIAVIIGMGFYLIRNGTMVYGASALGTSMVDDDSATEYDVDMDQEREQQ